MARLTEKDVLAALSHVKDPELGRDLVTLGMIKNVRIDEHGGVKLLVELTTPACPLKNQIQADVEGALRKAGATGVDVEWGAQVRAGAGYKAAGNPIPEVRNVILVGAGKGGVGKSTVALNLAIGLRRSGATVGILDADFYGPSMPIMLGTDARPGSKDGKNIEPLDAHGLKAMSIGFLTEPDQALVWRGPMLHGALTQLLRDVVWGALDYLVIDLPPGTGDIPLSIAQQVKAAGVVLVSTPQDVALADVLKAKAMFEKVSIPVLGVVENMSSFCCPNCGTETAIFSSGGAAKFAEKSGLPLLGKIPLVLSIREGGDAGKPVTVAQPDSKEAAAFFEMARNVAGRVAVQATKVSLPVFGAKA
jgi:ATP-binding protein involved in chromosome partitioning